MKRKKRGLYNCPKCNELAPLTNHHYLPVRFFGKNPFYIKLCWKCHEEIEKLIPERRLPACDYFEIAYCFIYRQVPNGRY